MLEKKINETILLKSHICHKDYEQISELEKLCYLHDKTNLKLELDFRLNFYKDFHIGLSEINEFLYYIEDTLVSYLSISVFGDTNVAEINGMTHPDFRKKGLFKKLFQLATDECRKRNFNQILLLSDGKSNLGVNFINSVGGKYNFSEYRMKLFNKNTLENIDSLLLRKAEKSDAREIARQNAIFFNHSEEFEWDDTEDESLDDNTYMIEVNEQIIGKIVITCNESYSFISGFGILPDFRGKGYGKKALKAALTFINKQHIYEIELDVECKNSNALHLYKSCGFEEQSVMNYYDLILGGN